MMQKVGRFQVLQRILTGETDAVYLVADPEAGRKLALKMVQLDWFARPDRATQLRHDVWNDVYKARRLRHPAIIGPEDVFEQLGVCWFVMDFVQGQDLGQLFTQKRQLEKPVARSIARQIAEALDYAHQAGLTHGRLRPSKLMLTSDGSVRILGFGLSRVSFSGREGNGHGIKSPHYLSPEQIAGQVPCAQSDQFALAAVVYQLLAGSHAFPGVGDEVRLDVTEREPQPAEELNPTLDAAVGRVLARALAKSPKERFPTCVEFAGALEQALEASPDWAVPVPTERLRVPPPVPGRTEHEVVTHGEAIARTETLALDQSAVPKESFTLGEALAHSGALAQGEEVAQRKEVKKSKAASKNKSLAKREAAAKGEAAAKREALAQSEALAKTELLASSETLAQGEALAQSEAIGRSEVHAKNEAVAPGEAHGQGAGSSQQTATPLAPSPAVEPLSHDSEPGAAAWLRWPKPAFPVLAAAALLAVAGIYIGSRILSSPDAPRVASQTAQALQITSAELPVGKVGSAYSAHLHAEGETGVYRWTVTKGPLPPGLLLDEASGEIRGTPAATGVFPLSVTVTSASDQTASVPLTITIDSDLAILTPPDPPGTARQASTLEVGTGLRIISQSSLPGAALGSRYSHALVSERGQLPLRWTLQSGSLPQGLSLSSSTGMIEGSPSAAGRFSFDVRVTDASETAASQRFSMDVAVPLVITSTGLQSGVIGEEYLQNLEARGGSPPYEWSLAGGSLPQGLSLDSPRSAIRGVPASAGAFPLRLRVRDTSGATLESVVSLEVAAQLSITTSPDLPAANSADDYTFVLAVAGGRPPYHWSVVDGSLPLDMSLDANSGRVRGRPGSTGDFLFSARVTDGAGTQTQRTFRLTVGSSLRLSSAPMLPEAVEGQHYSHTLTAAGGRPPYQWSVQGDLPAGLALDSSTGVIQGTPAAEGRFSFQIQLRGAAGETASRSAGLLVQSGSSGEIVWRGNLEANRVLTIQDGRYPSSGTMTGSLPGVPIAIEIEPQGLTVVTPPGPGNDWKLLVVHVGDQPRSELIIRWKRP